MRNLFKVGVIGLAAAAALNAPQLRAQTTLEMAYMPIVLSVCPERV